MAGSRIGSRMNPVHSATGNLMTAIAELAVCAVWVWVAVGTTRSLRFLTSNAIPFSKRTIWLLKILALIVGAGGVMGSFDELGLSWYLAALPAGAWVFFALTDRVNEIVVPQPRHTKTSYRPVWESYRRLRRNVLLSYAGVAIAFVGAILARAFSQLPGLVEKLIFVILGLILLSSLANLDYRVWKLSYWPCPRCGSAFRGLWAFPWLPKRCRYCGLGRWEENPEHGP